MIAERIPEIAKLTREERLLLACELWDEEWELHPNPDTDAALEKLLAERWKAYEANPDAVISYEEMRKKYGLQPDV
ncbi:MAG: addiction module protein [Verrucomicrobiae bacterium]|nr:addiction module protein [Verrucomicrobiae bacterium]MCB1237122.1 addiction module protein [Verrucomicrobiae bacterium]MCP5551733.1 addiction module protein [Akkermansiaceae bacterium]